MPMHKVVRGDTFWGLARRYETTIQDLRRWNPGIKDDEIPIGAELRVRATVPKGGLTHILTEGQTLSYVATKYKVPLATIFKLNPGMKERANKLPIGTKVVVREGQATYKVKKDDTMYWIAQNHGMDLEELIALNPQVKNPNVIRVGQKLFIRPDFEVDAQDQQVVEYILENFKNSRITSDYGRRTHPITGVRGSMHNGIDFSDRKCGTHFKTPVPGKVVAARYMNGYGNTVVIECARKYWHIFAHANFVRVRQGDTVKVGDAILNVGTTGNSTGCHVHYQINPRGSFRGIDAVMNPREY